MPFLVISLIISNGLTLFNANFYDALFSALAQLAPLHWKKNSKSVKLKQQKTLVKNLKSKTKTITQRVAKRTSRNIAANIAAIPGESIPVVGIGIVIAITAMDLHDACEDLKDMDELSKLVGFDSNKNQTNKICGMEIPQQS